MECAYAPFNWTQTGEEVKNGDTAVTNGGTATWTDGANVVTIKVTNGTTVRTYKVTVTKS